MLRARLQDLSAEEVANTITHGFGLVLSVAGFLALVVIAGLGGNAVVIAGSVLYGLSLVTLYAASTVYHSTTSLELKKKLQIVDHCCIYLLIAGSYTPFGIILADRLLGQGLLAAIWAFAAVGIVAKLFLGARFPVVNVMSYLAMGWLGVFAVEPLLQAIGYVPIVLIVAGGVAYSLGVIFFAWKRIRHHHAIFHLFVLAGSILHYAAIVIYVVPGPANI
jgi:hemolysin III